LKYGPSSYVCHLSYECDYLSNFQFITHLLYLCWKKSIVHMKIFKLITWYPNMVQTMKNDIHDPQWVFVQSRRYMVCNNDVSFFEFLKNYWFSFFKFHTWQKLLTTWRFNISKNKIWKQVYNMNRVEHSSLRTSKVKTLHINCDANLQNSLIFFQFFFYFSLVDLQPEG